jgi:predicted metallopeptidase
MGRRMKVWEIREDYRPLLKTAKELFPTLLSHIRRKRILLVGFYNPNSDHMAKIRTNRVPWSLLTDQYDYIIQFWSTRFDRSEEAYKIYVMVHELMHIPEGGHDIKDRRQYRKLRHHDTMDFKILLRGYGIDMQRVSDIMKGEAKLLRKRDKNEIVRYPREVKIG